MKKILVTMTAASLLCACSTHDMAGVFFSIGPDVNERFSNSAELNSSSPLPDIFLDCDNYTVNVITDIHSEGDNPDLCKFVSNCLEDRKSQHFVLGLGDWVSGKESYKYVQNNIKPLYDAGWNVFSTPGNHDLCFGLYPQYREIWPRTAYQFRVVTKSAGTDLFICMDSADGDVGPAQREWLEETLSKAQEEKYRNICVFTHTLLFGARTGDMFPMEEVVYLSSLFAKYGVRCVLGGHDHYYGYTRYRNVDYYALDAFVNSPHCYYRATFGDGFTLESVNL